jgi:hypothetical protein
MPFSRFASTGNVIEGSPDMTPQRPDCVAGHVGLEVRRETGKE